jgi:hypothetical protein
MFGCQIGSNIIFLMSNRTRCILVLVARCSGSATVYLKFLVQAVVGAVRCGRSVWGLRTSKAAAASTGSGSGSHSRGGKKHQESTKNAQKVQGIRATARLYHVACYRAPQLLNEVPVTGNMIQHGLFLK